MTVNERTTLPTTWPTGHSDGLHWKAYWASIILPAEVEHADACLDCGSRWVADGRCLDCPESAARPKCFCCRTRIAADDLIVDDFGTVYHRGCA